MTYRDEERSPREVGLSEKEEGGLQAVLTFSVHMDRRSGVQRGGRKNRGQMAGVLTTC